jgi:cell fate (sporulation/competence/biofilm development) regulator YlbF (YheA/YmcA/DUF963 family)
MITKEKYDLIVKLLKEGRTNREICKIVRCSPNEITPIRKAIFGENTDTGADMKDKSICAQVFDLIEKGYSLAQIVIIVDIDPEEAIRLQDKYFYVTKRDKIVNLLKDKNDLDSTIEILGFLKVNPKYWKKIKEIKDLEIIIEEMKAYREEIEEDIEVNKILDQFYERQLQEKEEQLGLPNKY